MAETVHLRQIGENPGTVVRRGRVGDDYFENAKVSVVFFSHYSFLYLIISRFRWAQFTVTFICVVQYYATYSFLLDWPCSEGGKYILLTNHFKGFSPGAAWNENEAAVLLSLLPSDILYQYDGLVM